MRLTLIKGSRTPLGKFLQRWREKEHLTQAQAAEKVGELTGSAFGKWETHGIPEQKYWPKLAELTGAPVSKIVDLARESKAVRAAADAGLHIAEEIQGRVIDAEQRAVSAGHSSQPATATIKGPGQQLELIEPRLFEIWEVTDKGQKREYRGKFTL